MHSACKCIWSETPGCTVSGAGKWNLRAAHDETVLSTPRHLHEQQTNTSDAVSTRESSVLLEGTHGTYKPGQGSYYSSWQVSRANLRSLYIHILWLISVKYRSLNCSCLHYFNFQLAKTWRHKLHSATAYGTLRPQGWRVHSTHTAAETSYDRARSLAV